jgi:short-subunit dehydrogenase
VVTICPGYIKTPMTDVNTHTMPFIIEADDAARRIAHAIERGQSLAVIPWQMSLVGRMLKFMPNAVYDWAFSHAPRKPRKPA